MTKALERFSLKKCPWPDKVLAQRELTGAWQVGLGPAADQHYALRDGRFFRIAEEGEEPHAVWPDVSKLHPDGIPLRAVRIEDVHDADYAELVASLPEPLRAEPAYAWKQPMGSGGQTRTDDTPRAEA